MTLISVQCPNCGSPVEGPRLGATVRCPSCGSALTINQGSSGFPMAQLVTIGRDTGFLARQQAVERLKSQIERLETLRQHARQELTGAESSFVPAELPVMWLAGLAAAGLFAIMMGDSGIVWGLLLWGAAAALGVHTHTRNKNARREHEHQMAVVRSTLEPRIAALKAEIEGCQSDLARVEADLDRMAREF